MTTVATKLMSALALVGALLGAPVAAQQQPASQPELAEPARQVAKPALWKVSDADTTIYLFGTIHLLPKGIDWYHGKVESAFEQADELVTEIPEGAEAEAPALVVRLGMLPSGESLRTQMDADERTKYEAALAGQGLPAEAFDRYQPWFAAVTLATIPLMREGFDPSRGVEAELAERNRKLARPRIGLETLDFQLGLFAGFSHTVQKQYLFEVIDSLPQLKGEIDKMVDAWASGNAIALAELMNADESSPELIEALIVNRNKTWSAWIRQRLDRPGTVFLAVGAGHLGGAGSVQDQLEMAGLKVERVQ